MDVQKTGHGYSNMNRITTALLVIYLLALCWILLFKLGVTFSYEAKRSFNLVPFSKPLILNGKADFGEIILNVLVFVPLGVYAGMLFERWRFGKKLLFFFLISLFIEAVQFVLAIGAFDITDIITNTTGGLIGLLLFKVILRAFNNGIKAQKFINAIAATVTVLVLLFLFLLRMNMLPIRYQ